MIPALSLQVLSQLAKHSRLAFWLMLTLGRNQAHELLSAHPHSLHGPLRDTQLRGQASQALPAAEGSAAERSCRNRSGPVTTPATVRRPH